MGGYANDVSSFLSIFYFRMEEKLNELIELSKDKSFDSTKKSVAIKDKLIEALDMLTMSASDDKIKEFTDYLSTKIILGKVEDLEDAKRVCKLIR